MRCAKCPDRRLVRESTGFRCPACGGRWFREGTWREATPEPEGAPSAEENDLRAGRCPEGHGFMRRARVAEDGFFLERCSACKGVWFDRGEWTALAEQAALAALEDLWDPKKQQARREAGIRRRIDADLQHALGDETLHHLRALANALRRHPARSQALAWLESRLDESGP